MDNPCQTYFAVCFNQNIIINKYKILNKKHGVHSYNLMCTIMY